MHERVIHRDQNVLTVDFVPKDTVRYEWVIGEIPADSVVTSEFIDSMLMGLFRGELSDD